MANRQKSMTLRASPPLGSNPRSTPTINHSQGAHDSAPSDEEDDNDAVESDEAKATTGSTDTTPSDTTHDDDYGAIDAISDEEDDADFNAEAEEALLKESELDLIKEFKQIEKKVDQRRDAGGPWGMIASPEFAASEPNIDFGKDPFLGLSLQDPGHQALWDEAEGDMAAWRLSNPTSTLIDQEEDAQSESALLPEVDATPAANRLTKRVRFRRPSSVSSEEDPSEAFPDLMDSVAPGSYPAIGVFSDSVQARDYDSTDESDDDFDYAMTIPGDAIESDGDDETSDSDMDDGDTTDEDVEGDEAEREEHIRRARAKLKLPNPSHSIPSTPEPVKGPARPAVSRIQSNTGSDGTTRGTEPKTRVFQHDPSRAALFVGKDGVQLQSPSNPPEKDRAFWDRARRAMAGPASSPSASVSWKRSESRAAKAPPKPFTCNQTLGNIFDGSLPIAEPIVEPSSTISQIFSDTIMSEQWEVGSSDTEDHDFADEAPVDQGFTMNELVDFELCTTDNAGSRPVSAGMFSHKSEDYELSSPSRMTGDAQSTPSEVDAEGEDMTLSHLNYQPGLVTSFRSNQYLARTLGSKPINPTQRAETSERNAIQTSRRGAENLPFSPARRRRASRDLHGAGVGKSPRGHRRGRGSSIAQTPAAAAELQRILAERVS